MDLFSGVFNKVTNVDPVIVKFDEPLLVLGMQIQTHIRDMQDGIHKVKRMYRDHKKTNEIPNCKEPWGMIAAMLEFDLDRDRFVYMVGDLVTEIDIVPPGLVPFTLPADEFAIFPVRASSGWMLPFSIKSVRNFAYERWLPSSKYQPRTGFEGFEYYDQRSLQKDGPEIDLYVAIQQRS